MKNFLVLACFVLSIATAFAQKKEQVNLARLEGEIMEEGRRLYNLETAQMLGMRIFTTQLGKLADSAEGYFPYKDGSVYKCVFFDHHFDAQVLATITFDSTFSTKGTIVNTFNRPMNWKERDIYAIRLHALDDIRRDTAFYQMYSATEMKLLPMVDGNSRKLYVMTKSLDANIITFGNDYLLEFNTMNFLTDKKALHKGLITAELPYGVLNPENVEATHKEQQDYMTATDVCTIMMNYKQANWQHYVGKGAQFVTIWYGDTNELQIVPRKKWDKYNKGVDDEDEPVATTEKKKVSNP